MEEFITQNKQGVEKINCHMDYTRVKKRIVAMPFCYRRHCINISLGANIEINNKRSNKGDGLKGLL